MIPGAVAGTIPGLVGIVPVRLASHVGARVVKNYQLAVIVVHRNVHVPNRSRSPLTHRNFRRSHHSSPLLKFKLKTILSFLPVISIALYLDQLASGFFPLEYFYLAFSYDIISRQSLDEFLISLALSRRGDHIDLELTRLLDHSVCSRIRNNFDLYNHWFILSPRNEQHKKETSPAEVSEAGLPPRKALANLIAGDGYEYQSLSN